VTRLVPAHNPRPGGTYIWFTVPDAPAAAAEPECGTGAPEPEPEAEP
jgi:hypothetical protein